MKKLGLLVLATVLVFSLNGFAGVLAGDGSAASLVYQADSYMPVGSVDAVDGAVYFNSNGQILSKDIATGVVTSHGNVGPNAGVSIVHKAGSGVIVSHGTSYQSPFPYEINQFAGDSISPVLSMNGIYDYAVDSSGRMFFVANSDGINSEIFQLNADGSADSVGVVGGYSGGLAFDADDNLYYANQSLYAVQKFTGLNGLYNLESYDTVLNSAGGYIGFDADGKLLMTSSSYDDSWNLLSSDVLAFDLTDGSSSIIATSSDLSLGKFVVDEDTLYGVAMNWGTYTGQVYSVPEPASMALFGLGSLIMIRLRKKS